LFYGYFISIIAIASLIVIVFVSVGMDDCCQASRLYAVMIILYYLVIILII